MIFYEYITTKVFLDDFTTIRAVSFLRRKGFVINFTTKSVRHKPYDDFKSKCALRPKVYDNFVFEVNFRKQFFTVKQQ